MHLVHAEDLCREHIILGLARPVLCRRAMRAILTVVVFVVSIGAALVAYVNIDRLTRFTAVASTERTSIWIDTPHVTAGDTIVLRAEVTGGKRAAIAQVTVRDGERTIDIRGKGRDWGMSFTSSSRQQGSDELELALAVPADARAGSKLHLSIEVSWIIAEGGAGWFEDRKGVDVATLEVPILGSTWCSVRRVGSAAFAFGLLGVVCVLAVFLPRLLRPLDKYEAQLAGSESAAGILMLLAGMAYLFAGHAWFARPLVAATRLTGTWFVVLTVIVWAVLPVYLAIKLRKRGAARTRERARIGLRTVAVPEGDPYRENALAPDAERTAEPRTLAEVLEALRAAGLTPVARRNGFVLAGATGTLRVRVRDRQRVVPQHLRIDATEAELNLDLALALLPLFGPMSAEIGIAGWILVDGKRDRAQLGAEVSERLRQVAAQLLETLRATQPIMDELARRLGQ
jgi:hypothetical protein